MLKVENDFVCEKGCILMVGKILEKILYRDSFLAIKKRLKSVDKKENRIDSRINFVDKLQTSCRQNRQTIKKHKKNNSEWYKK